MPLTIKGFEVGQTGERKPGAKTIQDQRDKANKRIQEWIDILETGEIPQVPMLRRQTKKERENKAPRVVERNAEGVALVKNKRVSHLTWQDGTRTAFKISAGGGGLLVEGHFDTTDGKQVVKNLKEVIKAIDGGSLDEELTATKAKTIETLNP